jgi:hypothetical protein
MTTSNLSTTTNVKDIRIQISKDLISYMAKTGYSKLRVCQMIRSNSVELNKFLDPRVPDVSLDIFIKICDLLDYNLSITTVHTNDRCKANY